MGFFVLLRRGSERQGKIILRRFITDTYSIDDNELEWDFVRSSGPGGQNVNKVATAVRLRFDARRSPSLPDEARERLVRLAGRRATSDGVILIQAGRFRSQEGNRRDALSRLEDLIRRALVRPAVRRKTRPSRAAKMRRLEEKAKRSKIKKMRGKVGESS
jgi:ribosome-associated protein